MPDCSRYPIAPRIVAIATDAYLTPTNPFPDTTHLPGGTVPRYGQDITYGYNRAAPGGHNVGSTINDLEPKMRRLLTEFASGDRSGMAARLFNLFLRRICRPVYYFDDPALNAAAAGHENILFFCSAALNAPNSPHKSPGKTRIHQALKAANWDINRVTAPTDLGVPAFNLGSKSGGTKDFNNGLGVMINGVQHAYVIATQYYHDPGEKRYCIGLKFVFYDVFGLDDDDLDEYGATGNHWYSSHAAIGITAWWQLQHQHGYAPLVTRIVIHQTYECPAE